MFCIIIIIIIIINNNNNSNLKFGNLVTIHSSARHNLRIHVGLHPSTIFNYFG